ncbi:MAG TPA: IS110 family transposase [Candidatus Woesearchaeota archaeon]|nr:IS110 family transposase [Candidatus Woesearchaeota archaeon]
MFYAGFDIHQKFIYATILDEKSQIVQQGKFLTNVADLDNFLGFLPPKQVKVVMESCGIWEDFYDLLESKGYDVCLANPQGVKAIASAKIKNDKVDSEVLAKLLKADLIPKSYIPPKEIRELRYLVRHRKILIKHRTKVKNNIHQILRMKNIKHGFRDVFTQKGVKYLKTLNHGRINCFLKIMETLDIEIKDLDKGLKDNKTSSKEVHLLQSMPGIGNYAAQVIQSEIGDISRFLSPKKLCNYAGIVPSQNQSADKDYKGRITKVGSRNLR